MKLKKNDELIWKNWDGNKLVSVSITRTKDCIQ